MSGLKDVETKSKNKLIRLIYLWDEFDILSDRLEETKDVAERKKIKDTQEYFKYRINQIRLEIRTLK